MSDSVFETYSLAQLRRRNSVKWRMYPPDVLPLWVAEMDVPLAEPIVEVLREAVDRGDTGYAFDESFGDAFVEFAQQRYGWSVPTTPVLVGDVMAGAKAALTACTRRGDRVVCTPPVYPPFFAAVEQLGLQVERAPLKATSTGMRLDLDRLEESFATASAFLLCNPHNPTGHVLTDDELSAVARAADLHDVTVISDEIHAPLTMPGHRHIPFATLDFESAARSYTLVAASKAWNLAGLKAALVVPGPAAAVDTMPDELWARAGLFGVLAGTAAFAECTPWLDRVVEALDENRRLLAELLADRLPDVGYHLPEATYLAWLDFEHTGFGDDPAAVLLERGNVALNSGLSFGVEGAGYARLNLATSPAVLTEAVERMAAVTV